MDWRIFQQKGTNFNIAQLFYNAVILTKHNFLKHVWFWSNGTSMKYVNWCKGQPDNHFGNQKCLQMNYKGKDHSLIYLDYSYDQGK